MSLITLAVHDSLENQRTWMTATVLESLLRTVDWGRHSLYIVDNGSCQATRNCIMWHLDRFPDPLGIKWTPLKDNIGQGSALNLGMEDLSPNEHFIRIDNDVRFLEPGWADELEECVTLDPTIGVLGIKKPGICNRPDNPEGCWSRSSLVMLPKSNRVVEKVDHILGFCCLINHALFKKIGYLYQWGLKYAWEDVDYCWRSKLAGFWNGYIHCPVEDLDVNPDHSEGYQKWKDEVGKENGQKWEVLKNEYATGKRSLYRKIGEV